MRLAKARPRSRGADYGLLFLLLLIVLWLGSTGPARALEARLKTLSYARPGGVIVLNCAVSPAPVNLRVQFRGTAAPFFEVSPGTYRAFLGLPGDLTPGGYRLEVTDDRNQVLLERTIEIKPVHFPVQHLSIRETKLTPQQEAILKQEMAQIQQAKATVSEDRLWQGPFRPPVRASVSTIFGVRRFFNGRPEGFHGGIDFLVGSGTPVQAAQSGKVILAKYFSPFNANGNTVFIDHGQGIVSAYLHLSRILVQQDQAVKAGQAVGQVGQSGRSTGPHLHWSLYINGIGIDGLAWITVSHRL